MTHYKLRHQPLYQQIQQVLQQRIADGEWKNSEPLPSEWDLAAQLGVSQGTVRKALMALVSAGLLTRRQGRGTFVTEMASDWGDTRLLMPGLWEASPDPVVAELLGCSRVPAPDRVAEGLQVRRGAPLFRVRQRWRLGASIVALDDAFLSAERFEGMDARKLRQAGGVYALLQQSFNLRVQALSEQLQAVRVLREDAMLMACSPDALALSILRISSAFDRVVEWRQRYCLTEARAYTLIRDRARCA